MKEVSAALANGLWYLSVLPASLAFHLARRNVAGTQQRLLMRLLRRNAGSEFGRRYGIAAIRSAAEYQARVPLSDYEDYRETIQRIGQGQPQLLTQEPVLLLEPSSGSTAATKYIPYTASLKAEFQRAIAPWLVDVFSHYPSLMLGQAYWSVSPVARRDAYTPAGIPIGFEEESEYFGRWQGRLIRALLAAPPALRLIEEMETFRYITLLFLLRSRSLRLISIWNPTFLTLLVRRLPEWQAQLAADIARGSISPPASLDPELRRHFDRLNRPDPGRAAEIRVIFQTEGDPAAWHARLWPALRLISCWTEAQAGPYAAELARLFPQAQVQGKGLLATEGVVSFPLAGHEGAILALRSHFFEFLPVEAPEDRNLVSLRNQVSAPGADRPLLAHELEPGGRYEVILTSGGGLYRYQLRDLVEVTGRLGDCPLLRFIGKAAHLSDHFGEKLNEYHVGQALTRLFEQRALQPTLAMLTCEEAAGQPAYILFIELDERIADGQLAGLVSELEMSLRENFHYRYCRDLGQLGPVRLFRIKAGGLESYLSVCQAHGQRAGDIKPTALHRRRGWLQAFEGKLI
jgi:hypothetical protein